MVEACGTGKAFRTMPSIKRFEDAGEFVAEGVGCPEADELYEKYWRENPFVPAKNNVLFVKPGASEMERNIALSRVHKFDFIVICREDGTYQVRKNTAFMVG